jgi:hypothetical protein
MIYCPSVAGCCSYAPCGCKQAVNKAVRGELDAAYAKTCEHAPCPRVDCPKSPLMAASCVAGRCQAHIAGP